jgi:hypothetical protein
MELSKYKTGRKDYGRNVKAFLMIIIFSIVSISKRMALLNGITK